MHFTSAVVPLWGNSFRRIRHAGFCSQTLKTNLITLKYASLRTVCAHIAATAFTVQYNCFYVNQICVRTRREVYIAQCAHPFNMFIRSIVRLSLRIYVECMQTVAQSTRASLTVIWIYGICVHTPHGGHFEFIPLDIHI